MLDVFVAVRALALVLLTALPGPALGEPMKREANEWWWLHHECKMGESRDDGRKLSVAESARACEARDQLFIKLQENGYCLDYIELEMVPCADIEAD